MSFLENLKTVETKIQAACKRAGRDPSEIHLIAVSKLQPISLIEEAYAAGVRDFGENYVQECAAKKSKLSHLSDIRWHLIGPIQTNKVKLAIKTAHLFHALDSIKLAAELSKRLPSNQIWPVFLQVNIDKSNSKHGMALSSIEELARFVLAQEKLKLLGLMCIPDPKPNIEQTRACFKKMRALVTDLESHCGFRNLSLSMGMSDDFETAIEEGAHFVRIGRKLFGERAENR